MWLETVSIEKRLSSEDGLTLRACSIPRIRPLIVMPWLFMATSTKAMQTEARHFFGTRLYWPVTPDNRAHMVKAAVHVYRHGLARPPESAAGSNRSMNPGFSG